jgi:CBS domain-containing protein
MKNRFASKETSAILLSVFFLILGFSTLWFSQRYLKLEGEVVFVFLLLMPILVYAILSGRLGELKAGGLEAKFVDVAKQSIELGSETIEPSVRDMETVAKGGARHLERTLRRLNESKPIVITLNLGRQGYYDRAVLIQYFEALSQYRNFKFAVILDEDNRFVAYMPSWAMLQLLRIQDLGNRFVQLINSGEKFEVIQYPGVITSTISTRTTNLEALKQMTERNIEALVVIDDDRKLRGVVEREQILSKLLIGLAK